MLNRTIFCYDWVEVVSRDSYLENSQTTFLKQASILIRVTLSKKFYCKLTKIWQNSISRRNLKLPTGQSLIIQNGQYLRVTHFLTFIYSLFHLLILSFPSPQRQAFWQVVCRSSALSHPIWFSFSFGHVLLEVCQRTSPSGQQWAPRGSIQWSLFIMAFPDLSPVASQNVQPRSWAWRLHGTGGLALFSEPCVVGSNITWKQLGQSSQLSSLPSCSLRSMQVTPFELCLKWALWENDNHPR